MHHHDTHREWLETDGLGGFAMGTARAIRTRRYHGLLLVARRPPAERTMLVNGLEAWIETPAGNFALTTQRYAPGVDHPDGAAHLREFAIDPWPRWRYALPDGTEVEHALFVPHRQAAVLASWALVRGERATLRVRPLLSGRDFHGCHRENGALNPDPIVEGGRVGFRPYRDLPEIVALSDARYEHGPIWYRRFFYEAEAERGLDAEEDLFSPGTFIAPLGREPAVLGFCARELAPDLAADPRSARAIHAELSERERARRHALGSPLERAADAYLARRGEGLTIIAGFPWFGDWGRDTFIAVRGLCTAIGRHEEAAAVLEAWASAVDHGMLPNRFPDRGDVPEHNSVDAALLYVIAAHELLAAHRDLEPRRRARIEEAIVAIVRGHLAGTRHGIGATADGLLAAGEPGQQLTWMDARAYGREITPRIGKPVEVNALWLNALAIASRTDASLAPILTRGLASFAARFPLPDRGYLADVVDADHVPGAIDATLRPNQILAVGGLPLALVEGTLARSIVDAVEARLWTPLGLRSLAPGERGYAPQYRGGPAERDAIYHQGTVWPWLLGPFVEAWLRVRGGRREAKREARERFLSPLEAHLDHAGLGHVSEIADGDAPHAPRGCPFQAWSLGELLRLRALLA